MHPNCRRLDRGHDPMLEYHPKGYSNEDEQHETIKDVRVCFALLREIAFNVKQLVIV